LSGIGAYCLQQGGTHFLFYINGVSQAVSGSVNLTNGGVDLFLGNMPATGYYFAGQMDEVRLWSIARSASDIQDGMHHVFTGSEPGLLAYYQFDQSSGTDLPDCSTNGNNGILVDSPVWTNSTFPCANVIASWNNIRGAWIRNNFRHHLALALHHAENDCLVRRSASACPVSAPANVGFITFNVAKQRPFIVHGCHVLADKIGHAPSRFVGYAELPFQFFRRNAVPGSGEQIKSIEPKTQRSPAIFKQSSGCWVKMMSAPLASIGALGLETKPLGFFAALWADMVLTKSHIEQVFQARFISWIQVKELQHRYAGFFFVRFHARNIHPTEYLCQGDNSEKL
jgi:hypothetical protein